MLFHSPQFLVFFAIYFAAQLLIPPRRRLWLVLAGGTIFYGYWNPWLVWLPHLLGLTGWAGARWLAQAGDLSGRKLRFAASVAALLAPLLFFKYVNFLYRQVLGALFVLPDWSLAVPLPLGVSFVTFTMLAYLIDCYRGVYPVEPRAPMVSGYMVFFPHLIAGPILRPRELIPQLAKPRPALAINARLGLLLFTVGLAKKAILANQFADAVDPVYAGGAGLTALDYLLAIYGFPAQIYCDFSGYTDMALGLALLLGVKLPSNFDRPYAAATVAEYWRRWHRTLSFWLRDYIYIPLGGNRGGRWRRARNIMVTMILAGFWHGAGWTFALWGAVHGLAIVFNRLVGGRDRRRSAVAQAGAVLTTFHFVTLAFILFRASDLGTFWRVLSGPFAAPRGDFGAFFALNAYSLLLLAAFYLSHRFDTHARLRLAIRRAHPAVLWSAAALVWAVAIAASAGGSTKFIYFDF